ncbi:hypothetical protein [uncultured Meiothermus sp.]|jgi:hypothetical protein|uniref:hypothetical protein n=1 Tax=uncultured Meiothermus sp. TaxID=157471 RepID=UPI00261FF285|nr:hypothetical protein [uncultured Meiothermus sp.]
MAKEKAALPRIEKERSQFRELIAKNPNYFGNETSSALKAVLPLSSSKYEEITCTGYNPDLDQLEAVVAIKLPFGYGGNLCQSGTTEYVRFWVNYGSGWVNEGLTAFKVHDIPNTADCAKDPDKPLTYALSLKLDPRRWCCDTPLLPRVRAILSWEVVPPAGPGAENWKPVWGSVLENHIQIKPLNKWWCLLDTIQPVIWEKFKVVPELAKETILPIPLPDPPPLELPELVKLYGGKPAVQAKEVKLSVEPHRFAVQHLHQALTAEVSPALLQEQAALWKGLGLDWVSAIEALGKTKGNTGYEELDCLALDTNREWMVATFTIKRPNGYSGDLCSKGSTEYVAFWADWHDTCEWTYMGTAQVKVHDIASIPAGGLHYAAILKVDLNQHRRSCDKTRPSRIRAVLSWNTPPSTTNPDAVPYWGNRMDAHVVIRSGRPGINLYRIGGIVVTDISASSGLTLPSATFENGIAPDALGRPCPFAGRVVVTGPTYPGLYYRVQVRRQNPDTLAWESWGNVTTTLKLVSPSLVPFTNAEVMNGFFAYAPDIDNRMAWWDTAGDALWELRIQRATAPNELAIVAEETHRVQLDNTWPEADISIDSGGNCKDFIEGVTITGRFVARDPYFGSYSLGTLPFAAPAGQPVPSGGTTPTAAAPGNAWSLNTAGMQPCGYVMVVSVSDRAIVNSASVGHHSSKAVGFCLREKKK